MLPPSSPLPRARGESFSNTNLSISHTTGGFAAPLGPSSEADNTDSAALEMLPGSDSDHRTPMLFHSQISSFPAASSFALGSYANGSEPQFGTLDPTLLRQNGSSAAKPWSPLVATGGVRTVSDISTARAPNDYSTFVGPTRGQSRSLKDSGLGTEDWSQYDDTQSHRSHLPTQIATQIQSYYPLPLPPQSDTGEVIFHDDDYYQTASQTGLAPDPPRQPQQGLRQTQPQKSIRQSTRTNKQLKCERCGKTVKTPSEMTKHIANHERPFRCGEPNCPNSTGFPTQNDLDRHLKSVHQTDTGSRNYKCFAPGCPKADKIWPRRDNFTQHLKRLHKRESLEELIKLSEEWYDRAHTEDAAKSDAARNQVQSQEQHVVIEEKKRKRTGFQDQTDDGNKRTYRHTMATIRAPSSQAMTPSSSVAARQRDQELVRGPATGVQGHSQHRRKPAFTQGISRRSSASVQQAPSHVSSLNAPTSSTNMHSIDPQMLLPWALHEQAQVSGSSMMGQTIFLPQQPSFDPIQSKRNQPRTIADLEDLAELRNQQAVHEWRLDPPFSQLPPGDLAEIGAANRPVSDTSGLMDALPAASMIPVSGHEVNSRVNPNSGPGLGPLMDWLDSYEANPSEFEHLRLDQKYQQLLKKAWEELSGSKSSMATGGESSLHLHSSTAEEPGPQKGTKCAICAKVKKLPSELKKHLKRHSRPYGCVLDGCFKRFGSKNDWKRHEGTHPTQAQCFRCDGGHSCPESGIPCKKAFYVGKADYCQHLLDCQVSPDQVNEIAERRLINDNYQRNFWCGFCDDIVRHDLGGLEALTKRHNHIDSHFQENGLRTDDWIELDGEGKKKKEIQQLQNEIKAQQQQEQGITLNRPPVDAAAMHGMSKDSNSSLSFSLTSEPSVSSPQQGAQQQDNSLQDYNDTVMVVCCQCKWSFSPIFIQHCVHCRHAWCEMCAVEGQRDESYY